MPLPGRRQPQTNVVHTYIIHSHITHTRHTYIHTSYTYIRVMMLWVTPPPNPQDLATFLITGWEGGSHFSLKSDLTSPASASTGLRPSYTNTPDSPSIIKDRQTAH